MNQNHNTRDAHSMRKDATTNSRRWTQYVHLAGNKQKRHSGDKTWNITDDETSRTKHKTREWQNKTGRTKQRDQSDYIHGTLGRTQRDETKTNKHGDTTSKRHKRTKHREMTKGTGRELINLKSFIIKLET